MTLMNNFPHILLATLLAGCAVQNAASGYDGDEDAAKETDVIAPPFDLPEADAGKTGSELDVGLLPVDADGTSTRLDTGAVSRPDVSVGRDVIVAPTDRAVSMDGCAAQTSCTSCAAQAPCGWCGATGRCVAANATRTSPAVGACVSAWSGATAACMAPVDPCAPLADCGSCASDPRCGWCRTGAGRCISGTRTGPSAALGTCANWAYLLNECGSPTDPCSTARRCGSCTDRGSCGWCDDSNTCHSGTSSGPTARGCRSSRWTWDNFFGVCL